MTDSQEVHFCPDCMSRCPWCLRRRWETRAYGCGSVLSGSKSKACRKAKRLTGVPCPKCGLATDHRHDGNDS